MFDEIQKKAAIRAIRYLEGSVVIIIYLKYKKLDDSVSGFIKIGFQPYSPSTNVKRFVVSLIISEEIFPEIVMLLNKLDIERSNPFTGSAVPGALIESSESERSGKSGNTIRLLFFRKIDSVKLNAAMSMYKCFIGLGIRSCQLDSTP